ncbi:hypothetical protein NJH78_25610 [Pseudomonas chlororaphis]|uniref:hypothetical protein n=1 Tax=Pseudomonas chlororaphis TaxID=587753 RepID=UPI00209A93F9|nr:hypothetical protein [Pseudomonas chlororaphis]MCO7573370.1 hypothetical protein [Pseudomonas chlororaphis]MCO7591236.1 hypothetical protein [Pseudomonas chlororaphis]
MAKRIKFLDLLPIYKAMEKAPGSFFELKITNEVLQQALALAVDESNIDESGISVHQGDYQNIKLGDVFLLNVMQPRIGLGILAESFSKYITTTGAHTKERDNYYLIDEKFYSTDQAVPVVVSKYRQTLRLIYLLAESAHYLDTAKEEMIFYKDGRFVVPIIYGKEEISKLNLSVFEGLERFVLDPYHKEQKIKMLGENLIEMLAMIPLKERFSYLISNLDDLYKRLQAGYNLFASDYTYEKAVTEVHAFKVDTVTKIHKAITDIQAQVLGLPIATFIALSQLKKTVSLNAQFAANTAIFFGVLIFCFLLSGFLVNQRSTLQTIENEVSRQKKIFEKRFEDKKIAYTEEFKSIEKRLWWQYVAIKLIFILDVIMLCWSLVYYIVHTRPIYDLLF